MFSISYSLFFVLDHFWKNSLSEHISCTRSLQNLTRSEVDLFWKKPLPIYDDVFLRAKIADGSVDAETEFHKGYFMAGENVGCKSRGKSKFITVIILNIFLQDEESILVH